MILAIGQENAFPWIERDLGIEFDKWDVPKVDTMTFQSTRPGVFFGGDAAFGPKNIIWAVEHGHQAAISIHKFCQGEAVTDRLPPGVNLQSRKMGMHEWSYSNDYTPVERRLMPHVSLKERFKKLNIEVELGFTAEQVAAGSAALPQLRRADRVRSEAVHRMRRLHRHLSGRLPDDHARTARRRSCARASRRRRRTSRSRCTFPAPLPQTARVMVKDEDLCVHCGLCAERCPTAAWDMQKSTIHWPHAADEAHAAAPRQPKIA